MTKRKIKIILLAIIIAVIVALRFSPLGHLLTFEHLKENREALVSLVHDHYWASIMLFIVVYFLVTALSIPGAVILTLAGGFLFGALAATAYIDVGATSGASLAFLSARYLVGRQLQEKYEFQLRKLNEEIRLNGSSYLLTIRFIPVFPFFIVNLLAGLTKIPLRTFVWTTLVGIIPGTAAFAFAGQEIGSVNSLSDILSKKIIAAFLALAFIAILPVILKRIRGARKKT